MEANIPIYKTRIGANRLIAGVFFLTPLILGQAIAFFINETFSWSAGLLTLTCGLGLYLCVVCGNAYTEHRQHTDIHRSPKTLPTGTFAALIVTGAGLYLAFYLDRPLIFPLTVIGLALFWAYHFPPLQLAMRGGGEILQALGFGLLLPLIGYYAQSGNWRPLPQALLMPYILLQLAAAIAYALPNRKADIASSKKTWSVLLGNRTAAAIAVAACLGAQYQLVWSRSLPTLLVGLMLIPVAALLASAPLHHRLDDSFFHQCVFKKIVFSAGYIYALGFSLAQLWN